MTIQRIFFDVGTSGGSQTLTQSSRFDNSNSLAYAHTLTPGTVTLTQSSRYDNSNALSYTHTLSQANSPQTLTQSTTFANDATFFAHHLPYAQTLTQSATFSNTPTFFTHGLTTSLTLVPSSRFDNSNSLNYTHVVSASTTLNASRFDNENLFYAHVLTPGSVTLAASLFSNSNTFFSHTLSQPSSQTLTQSATATNSQNFYTQTLSQVLSDIARPISDVSGTWSASTGTDKYAMVDEVAMDNTDYIYTNAIGAKQRMQLSAVADPGTTSGQVFSYAVWSPSGHGITVRLLNRSDDSLIAEWAHPGPISTTAPSTPTEQSLTPSQIAAILDYAAIDLEVESTN